MHSFSFQEFYNMWMLHQTGLFDGLIPKPKHFVEVNQPGQTPFMTMEKMTGDDLDSLINKTSGLLYNPLINRHIPVDHLRFSLGEVRSFALQLLDFAYNCFKIGFVHRDIKCENMFFDRRTHTLKIFDFGLSLRKVNQKAPIRYEQDWAGTYVPWEFRRTNRRNDPTRVSSWEMNEVWCIGIAIFRFYSLEHAFCDQNGNDIHLSNTYKQQHFKKGRWDRINERTIPNDQIRRLLDHMLHPNPEQRYGIMELYYYVQHLTTFGNTDPLAIKVSERLRKKTFPNL